MNERGISSVELLVVLLILSVVAGAVLPKIWFFSSFRLDYEAAYLVSELRYLQEFTQTTQRVLPGFDSLGGEAMPVLTFQSHSYHISQGYIGNIRRHELSHDITLDTNRGEIWFGRNGDANPTTIRLWQGNEHRTVFIDRVGRIRIGENWEDEADG